ncbi:MAG: FMN-binding protein [Frankiales bacterium]|nr:FMN-binding protein [Frankiales bacterium]
MRKILLAFMTTLAAVVSLFGYRTSTPHPVSVATSTVAAAGSGGTTTTDGGTTAATPAAPSTGAASSTVTGDVVQTRWGPVQVRITVASGKVTAASAVQVPSGNGRDAEINGYAVPVLDQETVSAQSASIDAVSGATVTSDGYVTSLQSALDAAGL